MFDTSIITYIVDIDCIFKPTNINIFLWRKRLDSQMFSAVILIVHEAQGGGGWRTLSINKRGNVSTNTDCHNVLLFTSPSSARLTVVDIFNSQTTNRIKHPTSLILTEKSEDVETFTSDSKKNILSLHKSRKNAFMAQFSRQKNKGRNETFMQNIRHFGPILTESGYTR